jgi:hypothetical protein
LSPHLQQVRSKAERLTREFLPQDWHGAPEGKWCASQIFEHLMLAFTATTKGLLKVMQAGEPFCRDITWRDRAAKFYVVQLGIFPKGVQAPKHTLPNDDPQVDLLRRFNDALVAMDATLTDAERRFGKSIRVLDHPIVGPLTAQEWRRFHRVHAYHHFRQIAARRGSASLTKASA